MVAGKKILVTGADGFIGSHVTEALVRAGAETRAFCFYNSNGSLGWLDTTADDVRGHFEPVLGDIRDAGMVKRAIEGVDIVLNLAALIAIPYSYRAPQSFVDTNVSGMLNVLEAVRGHGNTRLVHTSTSEVYGTPDSVPIRESHALRGQSPYSATKIAGDMLCEAYYRSFDTPVVILRPFNTYGPRQSARAVIPTILSQMLSGRTQIALGSTAPKRDLTFVSDTVAGFLAAATQPGIEGQTIQLGTGRTESVLELFEAARRVTGVDATIVESPERFRPDASEVMILQSDPSNAFAKLGWKAAVTLEEGLARTAEWMRSHLHAYRPAEYAV